MRFRPLIQNSSRYFSRLKRLSHTETLTSTEHHSSSLQSTLTLLGPAKLWKSISAARQKTEILVISSSSIGECGSTLYVGLAHVVPSTNTKFKPLLLPAQMGMPYTNTYKHRISLFQVYTYISGSSEALEVLFRSPT